MNKQSTEIEPSDLQEAGKQSDNVTLPRQNPGQLLQAAREDAGLSCEQLAQLLHLTTTTIHILEQGRFEDLRGSTYVRGYLRNYCRQVNLDLQNILELYDNYIKPAVAVDDQTVVSSKALPASSTPTRPPATHASNQQHIMSYGIAVAIMLGTYIFWSNTNNEDFIDESDILNVVKVETAQGVTLVGPFAEYDEQNEELDVNVPLNLAEEIDLEKHMALQISESTNQTATVETQITLNSQAEVNPETTEPIIAINNVALENITLGNHEIGMTSQLSFFFTDDCWVEVLDGNNKLIFAQLARAEDSLKLEGVPPFQVKLGYAPGVSLSYNGESVPIRSSRESKTVELTLGSS